MARATILLAAIRSSYQDGTGLPSVNPKEGLNEIGDGGKNDGGGEVSRIDETAGFCRNPCRGSVIGRYGSALSLSPGTYPVSASKDRRTMNRLARANRVLSREVFLARPRVAYRGKAELPFDNPKRVFHLGAQ